MRLLLLISFICFGVSNLSAQGLKNMGKKALEEIRNTSRNTEILKKGPRITPALPQVGAAGTVPSIGQSALQGPSMPHHMATKPLTTHGLEAPVVPESHLQIQREMNANHEFSGVTPEERELLQQFQAEVATNEQLLQEAAGYQFGGLDRGFGKSVLSIPNVAVQNNPELLLDGKVPAYTVTVIKTNFNGKEEIFGIIPTHSIPNNYFDASASFGVMQHFNVTIKLPSGEDVLFPGEVVQVSPESMLDISLVKFSPEAERFLTPLELADTPAQLNEILLSYGFASGRATEAQRVVEKMSLISVRTNLINVNGPREGFCGSPLLDAQGRVKGIHTGSWEGYSYGTHVTFINKLLEAYHNQGRATYDLILNDHVLTKLNVDEYISAYGVADENMELIFKEDGIGSRASAMSKYSERRLQAVIKAHPQAHYLILHSRKPFWDRKALVEDRTLATKEESGLREHVYDLTSHQFLYTTDEFPVMIMRELDGMPIR